MELGSRLDFVTGVECIVQGATSDLVPSFDLVKRDKTHNRLFFLSTEAKVLSERLLEVDHFLVGMNSVQVPDSIQILVVDGKIDPDPRLGAGGNKVRVLARFPAGVPEQAAPPFHLLGRERLAVLDSLQAAREDAAGLFHIFRASAVLATPHYLDRSGPRRSLGSFTKTLLSRHGQWSALARDQEQKNSCLEDRKPESLHCYQ